MKRSYMPTRTKSNKKDIISFLFFVILLVFMVFNFIGGLPAMVTCGHHLLQSIKHLYQNSRCFQIST